MKNLTLSYLILLKYGGLELQKCIKSKYPCKHYIRINCIKCASVNISINTICHQKQETLCTTSMGDLVSRRNNKLKIQPRHILTLLHFHCVCCFCPRSSPLSTQCSSWFWCRQLTCRLPPPSCYPRAPPVTKVLKNTLLTQWITTVLLRQVLSCTVRGGRLTSFQWWF